ncbi:CHAD domain-containing protein [Nitratireductor sp. CH_MIT9313-5]|uniref:CHAD domain-containing protein n=1 Tax=Nitratireductor sp. CH_MIT9313-5 TaxID=3107764 RepID=UPI00300A5FE8
MSYRIDPALPVDAELRRIAGEELATMRSQLKEMPEGRQRALHMTRKSIKRLRGLLRLIRKGDEDFYHAQNARLRDLARALSRQRDADAAVETLDRLLEREKDDDKREVLGTAHRALDQRRVQIIEEEAGRSDLIPSALEEIDTVEHAFAALALPADADEGAKLLASGARTMITKARKAFKHARKRGDEHDFHEMRKSVKYHWMHLGLLGPMWPGSRLSRRKRAERLGDVLGELNDIANLSHLLKADELSLDPKAAKLLQKRIGQREKQLRRQALAHAEELFDKEGKKLRRKIERVMQREKQDH